MHQRSSLSFQAKRCNTVNTVPKCRWRLFYVFDSLDLHKGAGESVTRNYVHEVVCTLMHGVPDEHRVDIYEKTFQMAASLDLIK